MFDVWQLFSLTFPLPLAQADQKAWVLLPVEQAGGSNQEPSASPTPNPSKTPPLPRNCWANPPTQPMNLPSMYRFITLYFRVPCPLISCLLRQPAPVCGVCFFSQSCSLTF